MQLPNTYIAIMAGGSGTRFWPRSTSRFPKQFLDILGTGKTLLQQTYDRCLSLVVKENILILTNQYQLPVVYEQLPDIPNENILAEPISKNTSACLVFLSFYVRQKSSNAKLVVIPSDHLIQDIDGYNNCLCDAVAFSEEKDALITLGIRPTSPHTGYGYIQMGEKEPSYARIHKTKTFIEKPNLELAKQFLQIGEFLWNAGIFVWKVETGLKAMQQHMPVEVKAFEKNFTDYVDASNDKVQQQKILLHIFEQCRNISIDYALLEHANNVYVVASDFRWNDLGSWTTIYDLKDKDANQNVLIHPEQAILLNTKDCLIDVNIQKLVVIDGLDDYLVVDTNEALLICKKSETQKIKNYLDLIKEKGKKDYL